MGEKVVNVRIRFPEDIHERVKAFAGRDRRSLNAEVLALLEEAMNARQQPRLLNCAESPSPYSSEPPAGPDAPG